MNIHFIGIGGIGMSALAQWCVHRGDSVMGSDSSDSAIIEMLQAKGIEIMIGQKAENITEDIELVVYTEAVSDSNVERQKAQNLHIPQYSYFEYLGKLSENYKTIAVAGTHGKTTTTGLIASGFLSEKFDATVVVGSTLKELGGSNFYPGTNDYFLVEACEYRENFRFLKPEIVLLTGVDYDHVDAFPTRESYIDAFRRFCLSTKTVVFHAEDEGSKEVLSDFQGEKIEIGRGNSGDCPSPLSLNILGDFNQRNAALAVGLGKILKLGNDFETGLESFSGAGRRQELLGEKNGIQIYDDYAHHPTELTALLKGFHQKFSDKKIGLIFEPHQFSRTKMFFEEFKKAFENADEVGLFPIYEARDTEEDKQFSLSAFCDSYDRVRTQKDIDLFLKKFSVGDIVIFAGAGKISSFAREWIGVGA